MDIARPCVEKSVFRQLVDTASIHKRFNFASQQKTTKLCRLLIKMNTPKTGIVIELKKLKLEPYAGLPFGTDLETTVAFRYSKAFQWNQPLNLVRNLECIGTIFKL